MNSPNKEEEEEMPSAGPSRGQFEYEQYTENRDLLRAPDILLTDKQDEDLHQFAVEYLNKP